MIADFFVTPTNADLIPGLFKNQLTGKWTIPVQTFNTEISNYESEYDYLNNDSEYQKRVIDHFYFRLKEKWIYKCNSFRKLLKYFKVTEKDGKIDVSLITKINQVPSEAPDINHQYRKYIYRYIDDVFINKKVVSKILRKYVKERNIKWYDLINNIDTLKDLFASNLKYIILDTIYDVTESKK